MTDIGVVVSTGNPSSADVNAQPATRSASAREKRRAADAHLVDRKHRRRTARSAAALNCITATQTPPTAASTIRLRISAPARPALAPRETEQRDCGQRKPSTPSSSHQPSRRGAGGSPRDAQSAEPEAQRAQAMDAPDEPVVARALEGVDSVVEAIATAGSASRNAEILLHSAWRAIRAGRSQRHLIPPSMTSIWPVM